MMNVQEIGAAMLTAKVKPMDDMESMVLISLVHAEQEKVALPQSTIDDFSFQVIKRRLSALYNKEIADDYCIAAFADQSPSPGIAVLYAATLGHIYTKTGKIVTLSDICQTYFPVGFPIMDELQRIWYMQKVGGANSVDMKSAWETPSVSEEFSGS